VSDSLDDLEAFVDQLIGRHHFDNQANAQGFLRVDVIAGETVTQSVLVTAEQGPHEAVFEPWRTSGWAKTRVFGRQSDVSEE